jgi:hypothetical protein
MEADVRDVRFHRHFRAHPQERWITALTHQGLPIILLPGLHPIFRDLLFHIHASH